MKRVSKLVGSSVALALGVALVVPMATSWSEPVRETVTVPAGQTTFSINLRVNEATAYAGIEFQVVVSPASAATLATFTPSLPGAISSPFTTVAGRHYFGFFAATNAFPAGNNIVGTISFTGYTSNQTVEVTVVEMRVNRINADNQVVTTRVEEPYAFTVQRPAPTTSPPPTTTTPPVTPSETGGTPRPTETATGSGTPTTTPSETGGTPRPTETATSSVTATPSETDTPTETGSATETASGSATATATSTAKPKAPTGGRALS